MPPAAHTTTTIDLMWDKPEQFRNIKFYRIYKNGSPIGSTRKGNFKVADLLPNTTYIFAVTAVDLDEQESDFSNPLTVSTKSAGQVRDITEFGAVGDGKKLCTSAIQSAINACLPGGVVRVPPGAFLTGALFLKSDLTLWLEEGSKLIGFTDFDNTTEEIAQHYPLIHSRYEGFHRKDIFASILTADGSLEARDSHPGKLKNISIIGKGTIDAQGSKLAPKQTIAINRRSRSNTITLINCESVYIQGINIENSPNWTIHPIYCRNLSTEGITMHTEFDPHTGERYQVENCDGWDPDSSENMYLYNATLKTHDDNVAIKSGADLEGIKVGRPTRNVRITDCDFPSGGGLAIGSEMSGGVDGVFVQDVHFGNTDRGIQIKTRRGRGGYVKNVRIKEIEMENAGDFGIMLNMRYYDDNLLKPVGNEETTPVFENFHFENIEINQARAAMLMPGLPESYMKDIHFKNIEISAATGLNAVYCDNVLIDDVVIHVQSGSISHFKDCTRIQGEINGTTSLSRNSNLIADLKVNDSANELNWVVLTNMQAGDSQYGDKPNYLVKEIPEEIQGSDWIRTANDSRLEFHAPLASFTVKRDCEVYVAYNVLTGNLPDWLDSSWKKTGLQLVQNIPEQVKTTTFCLLKKLFLAGSVVELGPNSGLDSIAMYTVIAKPLQAIGISSVSLLNSDAAVFKKAEWSIELIGFTGNPFDARQIQINVEFVSPNGDFRTMPAFWYKDFKRELINGSEVLHPQGVEHWRVRFTPHLDGEWKYKVRVILGNASVAAKSGVFHVAKGDGKGFIQVSQLNPSRFAFEDGSTYVPIGENNGWWASDNGKRSYIYETWFEKMAAQQANYSRIWMCSWGFGLIWQDSGLYDYTNRLDRAYQLDCLFELAEQKGIYLQLVLFHHGPFSKKVNPQWDENPFSSENGGPLKEPSELFTHPEAKEIVKNYIRYLVARYGYSTHLFCWELFNEINWMTDYDQTESTNWHSEMANLLHQLDPFHHLVSSSSTLLEDQIHSVSEHDFINIHTYESFSNLPAEVAKMQQAKLSHYQKPVLLSEIGISGSPITTQELDPEGIHFHQSLWSGVFGGGTGSGMTWWWDTYIETNDLYMHYAPLAKMAVKVPWQDTTFTLWKGDVLSPAQFQCSGYGYQTDTGIYLWVVDDSYHYSNPSRTNMNEVRVNGIGLKPGRYSLLSIDPYHGKEEFCNSIEVQQEGSYEFALPSWQRDMAFVIEKELSSK